MIKHRKQVKKQKSASGCPKLKHSKTGQTGTEIVPYDEYRKKYASKERGAGGLQEQVDGWLRDNGYTYLRVPDAMLSHIATCWSIGDNARAGMLSTVSGQPDDVVFIQIPGTQFNLAVCIENKSKTGTQRRNQKRFAERVNVNVCRRKEQVVELMKSAVQFIEFIGSKS